MDGSERRSSREAGSRGLSRREWLALTALAPWLQSSSPATAVAPGRPGIEVAQRVIPAAALRADVDLLARAFRELHPGLLRYQSADRFEQRVAALRHELAGDRPLGEVFLALSRFAATIRCGHTWVSFFNQSATVRAALIEPGPRLPFWFESIDRRMVITRDIGGCGLAPGTEVLRIDGTPVAMVLERLLPLARADGGNDAKRVAQLGVRGDGRYEAFDIYYPLVFNKHDTTFRLEVRRPRGSRPGPVTVTAVTHADRVRTVASLDSGADTAADAPRFEWRVEDGVAWLRMPTWALYNSKWDWRTWLTSRLDTLADDRLARALVVDLRGNEGGEDVGDVILERFIDRDVPVRGLRRLVRYRRTPADLNAALDTWDPSFKDWGADATPLDRPWPTAPAGVTYLGLAGESGEADARTVLHPSARRLRLRLFVLVDAVNSSATFQFAELARELGVATLIGEPTGGNRRGINGGAFFFLRLPASGLEVDLPLIGTFPATPQPDAGVVPDVTVKETVADIREGVDAVLGAALAIARA